MTRWRFKLLLLVLIGIVITVFFVQPSHGARSKHQPSAYAANYKKSVLTVGYLTAIHGEGKEKQGLAVSGAITLALSEVNWLFVYSLVDLFVCLFSWCETFTLVYSRDIVAFFSIIAHEFFSSFVFSVAFRLIMIHIYYQT